MAKKTIIDYFEATVAEFPEREAFVDQNRSINFKQLRNEARCVAAAVCNVHYRKKPVAVFLDKSVSCIAAFLGVLYSGNFYTPLDTSMPETRIKKILKTLEPKVVITDKKHLACIQRLTNNVSIIVYEDIMAKAIDDLAVDTVASKIIDTDIGYVLFTSGSTGNPKGVIISQRSILNYATWYAEQFNITSDDTLGNQAPLYFDLSIQDVYLPIITGCSTHLLPQNIFSFPAKLMQELCEKKVNIIMWSPSALCVVANLKGLRSRFIPDLRLVAFCGEVMPVKQLNFWRKAYPDAAFVNLYGPTEACDACMYYIINREFDSSEALPIGTPCKNTDIFVISESGSLIDSDDTETIGELCLRGSSLSYGYYANEQKTKESFVQNPFESAYSEKIYRTGDLVKWNTYGQLMYIGRKDFQIKRMGYRIELGEIETAASALDGVDANACVYESVSERIHLFYSGTAKEEDIETGLSNAVPEYMIPSNIHHMAALPLNLNGKIDRKALKASLGR